MVAQWLTFFGTHNLCGFLCDDAPLSELMILWLLWTLPVMVVWLNWPGCLGMDDSPTANINIKPQNFKLKWLAYYTCNHNSDPGSGIYARYCINFSTRIYEYMPGTYMSQTPHIKCPKPPLHGPHINVPNFGTFCPLMPGWASGRVTCSLLNPHWVLTLFSSLSKSPPPRTSGIRTPRLLAI